MMVMRAYNASKTLEATYQEIPKDVVDDVTLVDDASGDDTTEDGRFRALLSKIWRSAPNGRNNHTGLGRSAARCSKHCP